MSNQERDNLVYRMLDRERVERALATDINLFRFHRLVLKGGIEERAPGFDRLLMFDMCGRSQRIGVLTNALNRINNELEGM